MKKSNNKKKSINVEKIIDNSANLLKKGIRRTKKVIKDKKIVEKISNVKEKIDEKIPDIKIEDIINGIKKIPLAKIDREQFLKEILSNYCEDDVVKKAIDKNPAIAGIGKSVIERMAIGEINNETKIVTTFSAVAGMPGGLAILATIPADVIQYFIYVFRIMQKLAYLYGFDELKFSKSKVDLDDDTIDDFDLNRMMLFLGVMFKAEGSLKGLKALGDVTATTLKKTIIGKVATKTISVGIGVKGFIAKVFSKEFFKNLGKNVSTKISSEVLSKSISKAVPLVGGVVSAGVTYMTFKPAAQRLKDSLKELDLCDPKFYKKQEKEEDMMKRIDELEKMVKKLNNDKS